MMYPDSMPIPYEREWTPEEEEEFYRRKPMKTIPVASKRGKGFWREHMNWLEQELKEAEAAVNALKDEMLVCQERLNDFKEEEC